MEKLALGFETVDCLLCERPKEKVIIWPEQKRGHIVRCRNCDLVFRNPRRREEDLILHFKEEWTEAQTAFSLEDYRTPNLKKIVDWILQLHPEPGEVLDIGCSYGTLLTFFPEAWHLFGVDPSKKACCEAQKRLPQAKIFNVTLGDLDLPGKTFDVITLIDTIYYLSHPMRDLSRLPKLLRPGGLVLIESPNFTNRIRVYRWLGKSFPGSWMYFYTPHSLDKILEKAGLQVVNRLNLPGHRTGSPNFSERLIARAEFAFLTSLNRISSGYFDQVPHFVLMAKGSGETNRAGS
jgi:SAM-dependent methyltransferase